MSELTFYLEHLKASRAFAGKLVKYLNTGDVVTFEGTLGAGKTEFCRALIHAIGYHEEVPSPTFSLLQTYEPSLDDFETPAVWHLDLYRLGNSEDVLELGIEDGFDTAITLIEWPDKMGSYLPEEYLKITLSMAEHEGARHIKLTCTDYWTLKLKDFEV
jgi:tRNA threonylcarbamoyladenosine biosynthesis protein TsaE